MLRLNFIPHRNDLLTVCSLCNLRVKEDVGHFLGICPVLQEIRRMHFGKNVLVESEIFDLLNGANWSMLFAYCKNASSYRFNIINEYF